MLVARRRCPELPIRRALDLVAPVLLAAWAMGRLLGPQLMVAGGGHRTHQWFGMYYAGQAGRRLPVPIIQSLEDFSVFCLLIASGSPARTVARRHAAGARATRAGAVLGTAMVLWGIERTLDEHLWLGEDGHLGSVLVQVAGVSLVVGGLVLLVATRRRWRQWLGQGAPGGHPDAAGPALTGSALTDPALTDPDLTGAGLTDPGSADPGSADPISADPISADPISAEPSSADPITAGPALTDPADDGGVAVRITTGPRRRRPGAGTRRGGHRRPGGRARARAG